MCYDVSSGLKAALKYAKKRSSDPEIIEELERKIEQWGKDVPRHYTVSGFAHPNLLTFTNEKPYTPQSSIWGIIPPWIKDRKSALSLWNQTLIARAETMYEKPSFRASALSNRCLIYVDGFFEYFHRQGTTYPHYIYSPEDSPLIFGGLWNEWIDPEGGEILHTCSIVTTTANALLKKIHNNPKIAEARMPVILNEKNQDIWLDSSSTRETILGLCQPYPDDMLVAHPVRRLKGKEAAGNSPEAITAYDYRIPLFE